MLSKLFKPLLITAVAISSMSAVAQAPISVKWIMGENGVQPNKYSGKYIFTNISDEELGNNWSFYYNQFPRTMKINEDAPLSLKTVKKGYFYFTPNEKYRPLAPGDSIVIDIIQNGSHPGICFGPDGGHFAFHGEKAIGVPFIRTEMNNPLQWAAKGKEYVNYPDGNFMFKKNAEINPESADNALGVYDIMPTPKKISKSGKNITVPGNIKTEYSEKSLDIAAAYLAEKASGCGISVTEKADFTVSMSLLNDNSKDYEYYTLQVTGKGIKIAGNSPTSVLNGVKTFIAALERTGGTNELQEVTITDYPDLRHRGMMLDIARNYTPYESVKDFIDILASYKINIFQFHFNDDEAWRLEIPGIPELTSFGSRKGMTHDEKDFLMQTYAGNGNPDDNTTSANGYITTDEFIELIKYAHNRGVEIIPEIETPGHSRAVILSMKNRYNKYIDTDPEKAEEFVVWDNNDTTSYISVQGYSDNVLNLAMPGTYRFVKRIIDELEAMYNKAGIKLKTVHIGGDEVPDGAWEHSPAIKKMKEEGGYSTIRQIEEYYIDQITSYLEKKGIKAGAWQEAALKHPDDFHKKIAKRFYMINGWSTVGSRDTIPYYIANNGYPVILSNANNFYLDFMYSRHQDEPGHNWGGVVDEFTSWDAQPFNVYRSARRAISGKINDLSTIEKGKPAIVKKENIVGIQGQLWAETIRGYKTVQHYVFPKIFGIVERAWNAYPAWGADNEDSKLYLEERAHYNLKIGLKELPQLAKRGAEFHIGQPGIIEKDGKLIANKQYPGVTIRYTFDGSTPNENSPEWLAPVTIPSGTTLVKAKAFYLGKESVATFLWLNR
ncbi:MAG: family 20 glycosylhydrolase [Muribaculaceae bacterium]|nr:family 20 glycosylhydrolase [Muribaculaceae bacterium]